MLARRSAPWPIRVSGKWLFYPLRTCHETWREVPQYWSHMLARTLKLHTLLKGEEFLKEISILDSTERIRSVIIDSGSDIGTKSSRKLRAWNIMGILQCPFLWVVEIVYFTPSECFLISASTGLCRSHWQNWRRSLLSPGCNPCASCYMKRTHLPFMQCLPDCTQRGTCFIYVYYVWETSAGQWIGTHSI